MAVRVRRNAKVLVFTVAVIFFLYGLHMYLRKLDTIGQQEADKKIPTSEYATRLHPKHTYSNTTKEVSVSSVLKAAANYRRRDPTRKVYRGDEKIQSGKANAVIFVLVKESDFDPFKQVVDSFEQRFNRKFNYPYAIFSEEEFSEDFKSKVRALTSAEVEFGVVPREHWDIPDFIDQDRMQKAMQKLEAQNVIYGGSINYRRMCRCVYIEIDQRSQRTGFS
eukprot:Colp12_sorted_trinity150504_noHs@1860